MLILKPANSNMFNNVKKWYVNEVWNVSYTINYLKIKKPRSFKEQSKI